MSNSSGEPAHSKNTHIEKLETYLQNNIFPEFERGRPDWDRPHTESVVGYLKEIVENSNVDLDFEVLLIAAYAHDWGYANLFEQGQPAQLGEVNNAKKAHMHVGAEKLKRLLEASFFDYLTAEQKARAVHLVIVHDMIYKLTDLDEIVLMEADTLGSLDVTRIKPTFNKESNEKYIHGARKGRFTRFRTEYGKKEFERLYKLREEYYEQGNS